MVAAHGASQASSSRFVPFDKTIPPGERDAGLREKFKAEWPGILAWMIEGCLAWQSDGLDPPPSVTGSTERYFEREDTLGRWIAECCEIGSAFEANTGDLHAHFDAWCEDGGERTMSKKKFSQGLEARGFRDRRTGTARIRVGLRLRVVAP